MQTLSILAVLAACCVVVYLALRLEKRFGSALAIENAVGGAVALCQLVGSRDWATTIRTLRRSGVPVNDHRRAPTFKPAAPKHLPWRVRGANVFEEALYFVDLEGRPCAAMLLLPRGYKAERDAYSQSVVGRWGDATGLDCDGGHLLPYAIGGIGSRLNLVPQATSLNKGPWAEAEEDCWRVGRIRKRGDRLVYYVSVEYRGGIVPNTFRLRLYDLRQKRFVHDRSFRNSNEAGEQVVAA